MKFHALRSFVFGTMLMLVLAVAGISHAAIAVGSKVQCTESGVNVRSIPAGSTVVGQQSAGVQGTVTSGPQPGILSGKNYTWWQVNFTSGADGWVAVDYLAEISSSKADLYVSSGPSITPDPAIAGSSVTVSFTVKNKGTATAAQSSTRIQIKKQGSTSTVVETTITTSSISAGSSKSQSASLTIPSGTSSGTYVAYITLDRYEVVDQSDVTNDYDENTFTVSTPVQLPDLVVSALSVSPTSGLAGSTATVNLTVKNNGPGAAPAGTVCRIRLATSSSIQPTDPQICTEFTAGALAASGTQSFTKTITIPAGTAAGPYFVGATANVTNSVTDETDVTNNQKTTTFTVTAPVQLPDLVVSTLSVSPTSGLAGSTATVNLTVKNNGPGAAPSGTVCRIRLATSSSIQPTDPQICNEFAAGALAANGTQTFTKTVTIPAGTAAGPYFVGATANATNSVTNETDVTNNQRTTPFTVTGSVATTAYSISQNPATVSEGAGTLTFTVTRSGGLPAETIYASTVHGPANGYATNSNDYTGLDNQAVTFAANATQKTVSVTIRNDSTPENNETFGFIVQRTITTSVTPNLASASFTITDDDSSTSGMADSWQFPLQGAWDVSFDFDEYSPTSSDSDRYHLGQDVPKTAGTTAYAAANGIVKHAAWHTGYGYIVVIEHQLPENSFLCSVYGHLREQGLPLVGATISKGEIVGYLTDVSGDYGTAPHLHFGIRIGAYSTLADPDGQWRYRGYGPSGIVNQWHRASDFINNHQYDTDYPEATWIAAGNGHFTPASRLSEDVDAIVIHTTEDFSYGAAISWFQSSSGDTSAHYVVRRDGSVVQMVKEKDIAHHAGTPGIDASWAWNERSIGIEVERLANPAEGIANAQYLTVRNLVNSIRNRYNIPLAFPASTPAGSPTALVSGIVGHGKAVLNGIDPVSWNWTYFQSLFAPQTAPTITTGNPLPNGAAGTVYDFTLKATGGTTPYSWSLSAGDFPAGLILNSSGTISGTPNSATTANFTIKVTGANGLSSTKAFALKVQPGGGVTAPEIAVEQQPSGSNLKDGASTVKFGSVKVKTTTSKTFTIRNAGTSALKGISISKSGPHKSNFTVTSPAKKTLAPGGSTTFKVTFKPSAKGVREAAIDIASNDANENPFTIWLRGTGTSSSASSKKSVMLAELVLGDLGGRRGNSLGQRKITHSVTLKDGQRYLTLSVEKIPGTELPVVEVSPNLVDWYSGPQHTSIIWNDDELLKVRDDTPVTNESKRFIRARTTK